MLHSLVSKIIQRQHDRQAAKALNYRELVATIASGEDEPAAEDVEAILLDAGMTVANLQADVELAYQRRAWRESVDREPELRAKLHRIEAEQVALNARWHKLKTEMETAERNLREERDELLPQLAEIEHCRTRLNDTSRVASRQDEIARSVSADRRAVENLEKSLRAERDALKTMTQTSSVREGAAPSQNASNDRIEARRATIRRLEEQLAKHRQALDSAREEIDELQLQAWDP